MSACRITKIAIFSIVLAASAFLFTPPIQGQINSAPNIESIQDFAGHLDALSARKFLETHPSTIVLDVRTEDEIKSGFIVAAHFRDFKSPHFKRRIKNLDPSKTYLVHCDDGDRSLLTFAIMKNFGFKHVYHMDGGLNAWKATGLPVSIPY